jgi:hypothetical protein
MYWNIYISQLSFYVKSAEYFAEAAIASSACPFSITSMSDLLISIDIQNSLSAGCAKALDLR